MLTFIKEHVDQFISEIKKYKFNSLHFEQNAIVYSIINYQ